MGDPVLTLNGARANSARLVVPYAGRWFCDIDLDGAAVPEGAATVVVGGLTLVGTVVPRFSGAFVGVSRVRVVAGAGGWHKLATRRDFHDDGGVRRATVLEELARELGETIDTAGDSARLGVDVVQAADVGVRALDATLGAPPWRVDFDGVTRYGARPAATLGAGAELLDVDVRARVLTFAAPDPSAVPIGALVGDERMGGSLIVRELEAIISAGSSRVTAWGVLP